MASCGPQTHCRQNFLLPASLAVFRESTLGRYRFLGTWRLRFLLSPVEWLLILFAIALFIRSRRTLEARAVEPFVWFSALMILVLAKVNTDVPRYSTPFMSALDVIAAWMIGAQIARLRPVLRTASAIAVVTLLGIWSWHAVRLRMPNDDPTIRYAFRLVRAQGAVPVVVPQADVPRVPLLHARGAAPAISQFLAGGLPG